MADQYTPSMDDVRFGYAMHTSVVNSRISPDGTGTKLGIHFDEFDRALAAFKRDTEIALLDSLAGEIADLRPSGFAVLLDRDARTRDGILWEAQCIVQVKANELRKEQSDGTN